MYIKPPSPPWSIVSKLTSFLPFGKSGRQPRPIVGVLPGAVHPLIVVPGFLGTWPAAFNDGGGKLDPITYTYTNLLDGLQAIGYVQDVSLFPFPYDWRLGVEDLGACLGREISRIKQQFGGGVDNATGLIVDYSKVDLLAHSLGGLICRSYVQSELYANDVSRLALVATPNEGAVAAYYGYEGGETAYIGISASNANTMIGLLQARENKNLFNRAFLTYRSAAGNIKFDMQSYLSQKTASVRDLLPLGRSNYLYKREATGEKRIYPFGSNAGYPLNSSVEKMDQPEQLARLDGVDEICCFYSRAYNTRSRIEVEDRYSSVKPLYEHGFPLPDQPSENFSPGDTIVTENSACISLPTQKPDGKRWKVQVLNRELSSEAGYLLDHVQIIGDPVPVRLLLGYISRCTPSNPITTAIWDGPALKDRKPNYTALVL